MRSHKPPLAVLLLSVRVKSFIRHGIYLRERFAQADFITAFDRLDVFLKSGLMDVTFRRFLRSVRYDEHLALLAQKLERFAKPGGGSEGSQLLVHRREIWSWGRSE